MPRKQKIPDEESIHLLKESTREGYVTRCGRQLAHALLTYVSVWESDVDCPDCKRPTVEFVFTWDD